MVNSKNRARKWTIARRVVQVAALLLFCLPPVMAGWGLFGAVEGGEFAGETPSELPFYGTLSSSAIGGSQGVQLLDPFAVLQLIAASKTFMPDWLLFALPVLIVYGLVHGRAFCGWVCPVNLLLELVNLLREKLCIPVRDRAVPRHAKLWVALGVLAVSALVGVPVFEAFSPISAVNKLVVLGSVAGVAVLAAIVVLELFWGKRVWCRSLCPLGGFYEALGKVGLVNVRIDHASCIGCDACKRACLCDPSILDAPVAGQADSVCAGDCMICGACIDACPANALSMGIGRGRKG